MDADARSAATGAGTTAGRWWGPATGNTSASTDVVSLLAHFHKIISALNVLLINMMNEYGWVRKGGICNVIFAC